MKKIIATLTLMLFVSPASLVIAREANWDAIRQGMKTQQEQQEKDRARFNALGSDASKLMAPGQAGTATSPASTAGVAVK
jgi:uncharacterized protein YxeA